MNSKPVGLELKMSDFNIPDVVPKLRVKPQHGTVLNTNNFALIWILVAFKGTLNTVCLFWGVGPLRARDKCSKELKYLIFVELLSTFLGTIDKQKQAQHTQSVTGWIPDNVVNYMISLKKILLVRRTNQLQTKKSAHNCN